MRSRSILSAVILLILSATVGADSNGRDVRAFGFDDIEWKSSAIECTKIAVLAGNPREGMHHAYLKMSDGCLIPPHSHTTDEYVTVVSGTSRLGVGKTADRSKAEKYGPGSFVFFPAGTPHYGWAEGECVLSQTRSGAVDFHWANPEDDTARKRE
ncbi:MAG: cupin domain-containing protein [Candidatus Krumholzibacteriia bacterium]